MLKSVYFLSLWCISMAALSMTPNHKYSFEQCLVTQPVSFATCLGVGALSTLQSIDNDPAYDIVDGITFMRDEHQPRDTGNFLERDPSNYRMIVDTLGHVISQRSMRWDMSTIYPGLLMKVTPSANGVLEFIMDPHQESIDQLKTLKDIGTGRLLTRQILLPFLLGLKFKVATLIPIAFGILAIMAKKALIVSKLALILSSSLALGSIVFGSYGDHGYTGTHHHGHGSHYGFNTHNSHGYKVTDELGLGLGEYSAEVNYRGYNNVYPQDPIQFTEVQHKEYERDRKIPEAGRNFAWNEKDGTS